MNNLQQLGYDDWFAARSGQDQMSAHELARVVSVQRDSCTLSKGGDAVFAELSGNLLYSIDSALELPAVGDWVYADFHDDESHAIIHGVLPRKTLLSRKTPGKKVDYQPIAANIDTAFIVQSLNENFNLARLERYLVMVNETGIEPVILLSKSDLVSGEELERMESSVREVAPEAPLMQFSSHDRSSIDRVAGFLEEGRSYCLLGSSGVGKTTLLNCLMGDEAFETQSVSSKQSKGRHTTTSRQLVRLDNGAMIIDTPGMRELGNISAQEGLGETFADVLELARGCRFKDCTHAAEAGCAVQAAIESGELSERRYRNYLKMKREAEFNEMSYSEKRSRDKQFGKLVRSIQKSKTKR